MRGFRAYGLSIVITLLFAASMAGQTIAGLRAFNEEQREHGRAEVTIYENSLSLAFAALFLFSFVLHALGGARAHNEEAVAHGGEPLSVADFMATSQFWFESFQNWQSEFLSLVAMVVLSIFLRQRGSPESKPVDAAHSDTGSS